MLTAASLLCRMETRERHLKLLTETIEAVNSTLDLEEVLSQVATKVAAALEADACFVYLYDERADELVLRATHGTRVEEMTRRPRMRPGEGITGSAAAARAPVMLPAQAHLDPRFKPSRTCRRTSTSRSSPSRSWPATGRLEGALNVRTREPRAFTEDEVELLLAIAAQVAQSIEHAKMYAEAQRRVTSSRRSRGSRRRSRSRSTSRSRSRRSSRRRWTPSARPARRSCSRTARIAWPEGRAGTHAIRLPLRWRAGRSASSSATVTRRSPRRTASCSPRSRTHAAVALEHGRAVMRGVLAQEIHHRVKNNLQTVASLLRLQARARRDVDPREALEHSVNRILAIAAVHEVLTERRDEDVDLARADRPAARDARAGRRRGKDGRRPRSSRSRWPATGRPRSRSCSPSCCRTRSSTAAMRVEGRARARGTATSCSRSPTTATGIAATPRRDGPVDRPRARPRRAARRRSSSARRRHAAPGRLPGASRTRAGRGARGGRR